MYEKYMWMGMHYCKVFVHVSKNVWNGIIAVDKYMYLCEESICMSECDLLKCKCKWMNHLEKGRRERTGSSSILPLYIYCMHVDLL